MLCNLIFNRGFRNIRCILFQTALIPGLFLTNHSKGQNILVDLPSIPNGYSRASSIYAAPRQELEKGFTLSTNLATTYDSNVFQSSGDAGDSTQDSFVISPGVTGSYFAGSSSWLFGATLAANYDEYLDASEISGENYDLTAFAGYRGGKFIVSFLSGFGFHSGLNRFLAQNTEQYDFSNKVVARYSISPKTSIIGNLSQTSAFYQTAGLNDTTSLDAGLSALWSVSPLIDLGPGVRYGLRTQDNIDDLTVVGPTLSLNYELSKKVSLRSRVGLDFASSDLVDDTFVNWSLRLDYKASILWQMNLTLLRDTQANAGGGGGFDEVSIVRIGYVRKIRRLTANLGIGYESRSAVGFTTAASATNSFDYFAYDASLTMPVYKENLNATVSLRYRDLSSERAGDSWDGVQTGLGLSWNF